MYSSRLQILFLLVSGKYYIHVGALYFVSLGWSSLMSEVSVPIAMMNVSIKDTFKKREKWLWLALGSFHYHQTTSAVGNQKSNIYITKL